MAYDQQKHLELVSSAISRMAANSFVMKGWSVTAASALLAVAAGTKHQWVALIALLPTVVFWGLDGYYLALERRYRDLFTDVAKPSEVSPGQYTMDSSTYSAARPWSDGMFSWSVGLVHGTVIVTIVAVVVTVSLLPAEPTVRTDVRIGDTVVVRFVPPATPPVPPAGPRR